MILFSRLYQLMSATEYAVGWSQPNTRFANSSVMINSNIELCCSLEKMRPWLSLPSHWNSLTMGSGNVHTV